MRLILFLLILLGLLACSCQKETPRDDMALAAEIYARMDSLKANAELMQTEALQKYLSDEPSARFYIGAKAMTKAQLLAGLQELYQPLSSQKLQVIKQNAIVLGEDAILYLAEMSSLGTMKDGGTQALSLCETWLWQKQDGAWKVAHYHESWQDATPR